MWGIGIYHHLYEDGANKIYHYIRIGGTTSPVLEKLFTKVGGYYLEEHPYVFTIVNQDSFLENQELLNELKLEDEEAYMAIIREVPVGHSLVLRYEE